MHFWIDKRSQAVGRRGIPPNLAHIAGGGGRRWVVGGSKSAAPVHHHGPVHSSRSDHPDHPRRPDPWPPHHRSHPEPSSHRLEVDPYVVVSSIVVESPPVRTSSSHVRLRYALWASFLLILVFAFAGAKFYLYQQGSGGLEVVVTCAVMVVIMYLVVGCSLSLCRSSQRAPPSGTSAPVERPPPQPPQEGPSEPVVQPVEQQQQTRVQHSVEPPPPPYHIAVALPQCVTPPPSYDKAVS